MQENTNTEMPNDNKVLDNALLNDSANQNTGPIFRDKPKKKVGLAAVIIILVMLAAGGAGFGAWAFVSGNQKVEDLNNQISNLNAQLANQPGQIEELEEGDDSGVDTNISTNPSINTAEYLYIGDWGIKIKIGDKIKLVDVSFSLDKGASTVRIGVSSPEAFEDVSWHYVEDPTIYPGNFIARSKDSEYELINSDIPIKPIYNDGEFNYFVYQSSGYKTEGIANPEALENAYNEFFTTLSNKDNYSKI